MGTKQEMLYCSNCEKNTLHVQQTPNHILHLLLTVCTFCIWAIVWILIAVTTPAAQCTVCGYSRSRQKTYLVNSGDKKISQENPFYKESWFFISATVAIIILIFMFRNVVNDDFENYTTEDKKTSKKYYNKSTRKKASDSKAVALVKETLRGDWNSLRFEESPLQGGTVVLLNESWSYWVKDGKVYALNSLAKDASYKIEYAPIVIE